MGKYRIKITPSKSVLCDVDDTILAWALPGESFEDHPEAIEMTTLSGAKVKYLPMWDNIDTIKRFYERGYEVIIWSASSKEWAEQAVQKLGISDWVDLCISKPDYYVDDREVGHFMFPEKRLYKPRKL